MPDVTNIENKTLLATDATVVESTPVRSKVIDSGTDVVVISTTVGPSTVPYFDENKEYVAKPVEDFAEVIVATGTVTEALNVAATNAAEEAAEAAVGPATAQAAEYADKAETAKQAAEAASLNAINTVNAETYYTTAEDPDGTIAGLAGTEEGKGFRVAIFSAPGEISAYKLYQKVSGQAVYITSTPNNNFVEEVKNTADSVNLRTTGIESIAVLEDALVIRALNGTLFLLDNTGTLNAVEVKTDLGNIKNITSDTVNSLEVISNLLSVGLSRITTSALPFSLDADNGKVLYVDTTGKLVGIEADFQAISIAGIDLLEFIQNLTPGIVSLYKMGIISGYIHIAFYGQSQVIGTTNGTVHSSSFDAKSLMLKGGLRAFGVPGYNTSIPENQYYTSLRSMYEVNGETYCSGLAICSRDYIDEYYSNLDVKNVFTVNGMGGASVDALVKGTTPYTRWVNQTKALIELLKSLGESYYLPSVGYSQGGTDDGLAMPKAQWKSKVDKLRTDFNSDIKNATGVTIDPNWIINQINNYMRYPALNGKPNIGLAQYELVTAYPTKYYGACPTYILDFIDVAHWTKESQIIVGAYYEITRRELLENGTWEIIHPIKITTINNFTTIQFNLSKNKPLQFNTTEVAAVSTYGFSAEQADGTPININRVRLVSKDTVEIRYDTTPLAGAKIMYGQTGQIGDPNASDGSGLGRTNGMRGNLCDTAGEDTTIFVSSSQPNYPLHNWCWMFTESMGV